MDPIPSLPTRKVRGDSKLERLTPEQREHLRLWLDRENRTYAEIVELIRTTFSLSVGKSAVAAYWRRHILPQRYQELAEDSGEVADLPATKFAEAGLKLVSMHAYTALASSEPDLKTAVRLLETVRSADRFALARERVALEERRVVALEQLAAARQSEASARKKSVFHATLADHPLPPTPSAPFRIGPPPFPINPTLFPVLSAQLRAQAAEMSPPVPTPQPTAPQSA